MFFLLKQLYPIKYDEIINEQSNIYNLEPSFVYSVVRAESDFDKDAVSSAGAVGLMQIMPNTFKWLIKLSKSDVNIDESSLFNPNVNIHYGCYYLRILLDMYNQDKTKALCAYNAGMGNVDDWLDDKEKSKDGKNLDKIPYNETKKYVSNVLAGEYIYNKIYKL
jgi:soluble lytic murein transglycosylase